MRLPGEINYKERRNNLYAKSRHRNKWALQELNNTVKDYCLCQDNFMVILIN